MCTAWEVYYNLEKDDGCVLDDSTSRFMANKTSCALAKEVRRHPLFPTDKNDGYDSRDVLLENGANIEQLYQAISRDPKYKHFVRIPERIIRCLDYFGIAFNRTMVSERLHAYYLFIGVVDNAIDSGQVGTGRIIFEHFNSRSPSFDKDTRHSDVKLMTEILKCHVSDDLYQLMLKKLKRLSQEVVSERAATSIDSYIEQRKAVGRLTAELSYLLIWPLLRGENQNVSRFMQQVGAVGCLVDSIIDLRADDRLGLLSFKPTVRDLARLSLCALRDGLGVSVQHPRLSGLFFEAIVDNVRDRFRMQYTVLERSIVGDRKDEAASVA